MAESERSTLRVGILCSGTTFQHWQAEAIRHVLAVPGVEPVVLIMDGSPPPPPKGFFQRAWGQALYRRYRAKRFSSGAMGADDLSDALRNVPVLRCVPDRQGPVDRFAEDDLAAISAYRPDVLLRFGFNILKGPILDLPKHGVWSFHHGDERKFRGGPPGFWEIMKGEPVTGAILQRLTERLDGGRILKRGSFRTVDHSLKETVDTVLLHSAIWPAQLMRRLLAGDPRAAEGTTSSELGPVFRYPGNATFLRFLLKQAGNKVRFHRGELGAHEEWNIGVLYQPITALLEDHASLNVRWMPAPAPDAFRADPFGYTGPDGTLNVLYEKFDHNTGRGEIARMRPKADNVLKRSRSMLSTGGHLSYPYVVQREGTVYVIPESASEGRVDLYRVNEANDGLDRLGTLLHEPLFDPTVFEHEGRWWLFGTKAPLTNVELFVYHSDRFEGPYVPHALNPVKSDIRSARPGGTPFRRGDELWRPGQDSSLTYGGRIAMNRIVELTPDRFHEETVRFVGPMPNTVYDQGFHTVAAMGDVTLVDGKRYTTVPQRRKAAKARKLERLQRKKGDT